MGYLTHGTTAGGKTYDLLPCPHCGGEAKAFYDDAGGVYEVQCQECGAEPYLGSRSGAPGMRTLGDVIKAWNRRAERTCRMVDNGCELCCSECDGRHDYDDEPNYCHSCGAKVVDE